MFRKFAFIGVLAVLTGCETFSGMGRDVDNLMEMSGISSDIFSMSDEKATKAPEILPSTINHRTGIVIQSEQDEADARAKKALKSSQNKKASSKPLTAKKVASKKVSPKKTTSKKKIASKKKVKTVKKASSTANSIKKNPLCSSAPIDKLENVSQFYHFYYKKPKICKGQDYHDRAQGIYRLVLTEKDHQDIRLLNADHGFAEFTVNIMRHAPQNIRKNGAIFLRATGCGLIATEKCNTIINLN